MDKKSHPPTSRQSGKPKAASREDRLKSALKANMGRRKAQARARAAQTDDGDGSENDKG